MLNSFSPGRGTCSARGSLAATLAPNERASLDMRTLRLHVLARLHEPQFGTRAGVRGVRGLLVYSLRLECVFLELRRTSLVVASRGEV